MTNIPSNSEAFSAADMERLVASSLMHPLRPEAYPELAAYVELLYRWNARMNLTAVRDRGTFISLHLAECLLAGQLIPPDVHTMIDFGSGAGLPGIPVAISQPKLQVTLLESQVKKAVFLQEVSRQLHLSHVTVLRQRGENLNAQGAADMIAFRAVDKMHTALRTALPLIRPGGWFMILATALDRGGVEQLLRGEMEWLDPFEVPGTKQRLVLRGKKV